MKISLNMDEHVSNHSSEIEGDNLERLIFAAQKGDARARDHLLQHYSSLLKKLALKRGEASSAEINERILKGQQGLFQAFRKYRSNVGPDHFQIFALDFIEGAMDGKNSGSGFLGRLFGKK